MEKIAFFDAKPYDRAFFDEANRKFNFEIKYFEAHLTLDSCVLAQGCETVCVFVNDAVTGPVIEKLHDMGVRLIALRCAGYNNIDLKAAAGKVRVVRVPDYSPYAVAEYAVALMLALNRKLHRAYNRTRENNFSIAGLLGFDMHGKTAGVVGLGKIGCVAAKILEGFGMKVLGYDIDPKAAPGVKRADLKTLYRESDVITLHCPLTPETKHMINQGSIGQMKDGVMLINTGRGGLIDAKALIEAVKAKKIGAAGLDVYEEESRYFYEDLSQTFLPDDVLARLLTFNNVIVSSHQAFFTKEALSNIASTTLQSVQEFSLGKPLPHEVLKV